MFDAIICTETSATWNISTNKNIKKILRVDYVDTNKALVQDLVKLMRRIVDDASFDITM